MPLCAAVPAVCRCAAVASYRDSKVVKIFVVQMISSFGGLSYAAFFEEGLEGSCADDASCIGTLGQLVSTILVERLVFTLVFDNLLPRLQARRRFLRETAGVGDPAHFSPAEQEFILDPYDLNREIINR